MYDYSQSDFCEPEEGLDYLFARMGAIYGATFIRHWEGVNLEIVRDTWLEILGVYATYRPSMDSALKAMDDTYIPSALAFKKLCIAGPRIPRKPHSELRYEPQETTRLSEEERKEFVKEQFKIMHKFINSKTFK